MFALWVLTELLVLHTQIHTHTRTQQSSSTEIIMIVAIIVMMFTSGITNKT